MSDNIIRIILIRHAESVANTQRHLVGGRSSATPLSKKGREQARQLGIHLGQKPQPQRIITSPAIRTRETARYSLEGLKNTPEVEVSDEVQEMTQGAAEGLLREEVYTPEIKDRIDKDGKNFILPHEGAGLFRGINRNNLSRFHQY